MKSWTKTFGETRTEVEFANPADTNMEFLSSNINLYQILNSSLPIIEDRTGSILGFVKTLHNYIKSTTDSVARDITMKLVAHFANNQYDITKAKDTIIDQIKGMIETDVLNAGSLHGLLLNQTTLIKNIDYHCQSDNTKILNSLYNILLFTLFGSQ